MLGAFFMFCGRPMRASSARCRVAQGVAVQEVGLSSITSNADLNNACTSPVLNYSGIMRYCLSGLQSG